MSTSSWRAMASLRTSLDDGEVGLVAPLRRRGQGPAVAGEYLADARPEVRTTTSCHAPTAPDIGFGMAARRTRIITRLSFALALLGSAMAPAGAQVVEERSFFVVTGLFCLGPGPVHGVLAGVVQFDEVHGDLLQFCEAGDPPYLEVFQVHGAQWVGGGGGAAGGGATCRTISEVTVCTLPDGVSRVVAIFAVFEHPPPTALFHQLSPFTAGLN